MESDGCGFVDVCVVRASEGRGIDNNAGITLRYGRSHQNLRVALLQRRNFSLEPPWSCKDAGELVKLMTIGSKRRIELT